MRSVECDASCHSVDNRHWNAGQSNETRLPCVVGQANVTVNRSLLTRINASHHDTEETRAKSNKGYRGKVRL